MFAPRFLDALGNHIICSGPADASPLVSIFELRLSDNSSFILMKCISSVITDKMSIRPVIRPAGDTVDAVASYIDRDAATGCAFHTGRSCTGQMLDPGGMHIVLE